ncbi:MULTISPECIES: hypothetical protein [unclassified Lysinibacillus]|uniref:hypothetical protein n=1 Tax=unclassified Lysinibacillus TaxID=2636778 RepID=UPI0036E9E612
MNHHHPFGPEYYTTVLGYSVVIIICLMFFIHYLRVGLDSHESVRIDSKANAHK